MIQRINSEKLNLVMCPAMLNNLNKDKFFNNEY
jgi:hypothetical protein